MKRSPCCFGAFAAVALGCSEPAQQAPEPFAPSQAGDCGTTPDHDAPDDETADLGKADAADSYLEDAEPPDSGLEGGPADAGMSKKCALRIWNAELYPGGRAQPGGRKTVVFGRFLVQNLSLAPAVMLEKLRLTLNVSVGAALANIRLARENPADPYTESPVSPPQSMKQGNAVDYVFQLQYLKLEVGTTIAFHLVADVLPTASESATVSARVNPCGVDGCPVGAVDAAVNPIPAEKICVGLVGDEQQDGPLTTVQSAVLSAAKSSDTPSGASTPSPFQLVAKAEVTSAATSAQYRRCIAGIEYKVNTSNPAAVDGKAAQLSFSTQTLSLVPLCKKMSVTNGVVGCAMGDPGSSLWFCIDNGKSATLFLELDTSSLAAGGTLSLELRKVTWFDTASTYLTDVFPGLPLAFGNLSY